MSHADDDNFRVEGDYRSYSFLVTRFVRNINKRIESQGRTPSPRRRYEGWLVLRLCFTSRVYILGNLYGLITYAGSFNRLLCEELSEFVHSKCILRGRVK